MESDTIRDTQNIRDFGAYRLRRLRAAPTPARPGPGPVPAAALRALDLAVHRRVEALAAGEHRAAALGLGTELAQVRPYEPGDDVRRMDWSVTARTRVPHVRVHVAERALDTWLVLDTSPSMVFGTADRRKADVAEGAALAVSHLATRRGNRLGLVTFGDGRPAAVPARGGVAAHLGLLAVLRRAEEPSARHRTQRAEPSPPPPLPRRGERRAAVATAPAWPFPPAASSLPTVGEGLGVRGHARGERPGVRGVKARAARPRRQAPVGATSVGDALRHAARYARRPGLVVVVSDFRGPRDWRQPLLRLAARHDVLAVEVRDRREGALPDVGDVWLTDPETGRQLRADTGDRRLRERFAAAASAERAETAALLRRAGARHVVLSTVGDWLRPLATFFQAPHHRLRRAARGTGGTALPSDRAGREGARR